MTKPEELRSDEIQNTSRSYLPRGSSYNHRIRETRAPLVDPTPINNVVEPPYLESVIERSLEREKLSVKPALPRQRVTGRPEIIRPTSRKHRLTAHLVRIWRKRVVSQPKAMRLGSVTILIFSAGFIANGLLQTENTSGQVKGVNRVVNDEADIRNQTTAASESPDETSIYPEAVSVYRVAPELPRSVTIKKINVNARVRPVGVNSIGQLLNPSNIHDMGWFDASSKPGIDTGAVVLTGFVNGPTKPGLLSSLGSLVKGDVVVIERGDNKVIQYKIEKIETLRADQVNTVILSRSIVSGSQGLTIVSATETLRTNDVFNNKTVVYAYQVK